MGFLEEIGRFQVKSGSRTFPLGLGGAYIGAAACQAEIPAAVWERFEAAVGR